MAVLQIAVIAITAALLSMMVKQYKPELALLIPLAAGILIFFLVLSPLSGILEALRSIAASAGVNTEAMGILLKALGICLLTQFASNTCKDAGETALAAKVELGGKIIILTLAVPLLQSVVSLVSKLIEMK